MPKEIMAKLQSQGGGLSTDPETGVTPPHGTAEALLGQGTLSSTKFDDALKDPTFSVLFVTSVLIVVALAFSSGTSALMFNGLSIRAINIDRNTNVTGGGHNESEKMIGGLFLILFLGGVLSMFWIYVLSRVASKLVNITFSVVLAVATVSVFSLIFAGMYLNGVALLVLATVALFFFHFLRPRLAFATTNLKVACEAIKAMPSTILAAAAVLGVQGVFGIVWMMAVIGTATNESTSSISFKGKSYSLSTCATFTYSQVRGGLDSAVERQNRSIS